MVEKIDIAALRESIRKQYAEYPADGDEVLMFENRAAEVIADLAVFLVREMTERQTDLVTVIQGLAAIASVPLENLIFQERLNREETAKLFFKILGSYLTDPSSFIEDKVPVTRTEVGDA